MQLHNLRFQLSLVGSFSILGRIERDATLAPSSDLYLHVRLSVSSVGSSGMQLSHRCQAASNVGALSVSSVGSSGMQPPSAPALTSASPSFSILGRIERDATTEDHRPATPSRNSFSILGRIERDAT